MVSEDRRPRRRGLERHQFHAATEFFADFGEYDVTLTVPRGWVVGATGTRVSTGRDAGNGSDARIDSSQADVHDFAWTTSPDFVERRERFEEPGLPPVDMRLLLQPEHADQAERHFTATRAALKYYGTWFGPYPYEHITIVDPVDDLQSGRAGREHGRHGVPDALHGRHAMVARRALGTQPESVTVHEAGHQFWYGIVATNEFEARVDGRRAQHVLDGARHGRRRFPDQFVAVGAVLRRAGRLGVSGRARGRATIDGNRLNAFRPVASCDDQSTPDLEVLAGLGGAITYNKTALWLATLERMIGWDDDADDPGDALSGAARSGIRRRRSSSRSRARSAGQDLTWFFDAVHRSSATFDYARRAGHVDAGGQRLHAHRRRPPDRRRRVSRSTVRVTCDGTVRLPELGRPRALEGVRGSRRRAPITKVEVDPDRVLLLDVNYTNNSWTARPRAAEAASKWALRWLTWAQELLLTYAFFA